jgi:hypothetical protein
VVEIQSGCRGESKKEVSLKFAELNGQIEHQVITELILERCFGRNSYSVEPRA